MTDPAEIKYYMHKVDPHAGAEFADLYFNGNKFGITASENHPITQIQFICFYSNQLDVNAVLKNNEGRLIDMTGIPIKGRIFK